MDKIKKYLKKYNFIFEKILSNYQLVTEKENQLFFQGEGNNHAIIVGINENDKIILQEVKNNDYREIKIPLQEEIDSSMLTVEETIIEEREKGLIVEKNKRTYKDECLTTLKSIRYVISSGNGALALGSDKNLEEHSEITTTFSVHIPYTISEEQNVPALGISTPSVELNGVDISNVYEKIGGKNKIDRIFDLYRGIITEENLNDLYSIHLGVLTEYAYDYKTVAGISVLEDELVGEKITTLSEGELMMIKNFLESKINYQEPFDITNRDLLIKALNYKPTIKESVSQTLQRTIGMTYDEFDALDFDEQQAIIREYHRKNPKPESEYVTVMVGSGEHAIFQKVKRGTKVLVGSGRHSFFMTAGTSLEESLEELPEEPKQHSKTPLKQKVKSKLNHFLKREKNDFKC